MTQATDSTASATLSGRELALKRRKAMALHGKSGTAKAASLARRKAQSTRGKAGISNGSVSAAQTARAGNPNLSSRDLSKALREQRSKNGASGQKKSRPSGRVRPVTRGEAGAAQDQPWKVGASETVQGQTVTGTMVGRSTSVTGDEPSTCRAITGTEYLGADMFREFCQTDPANPSRHRRHSFFLVPTDTAGFTAVKIHGKMGIRASDTAYPAA